MSRRGGRVRFYATTKDGGTFRKEQHERSYFVFSTPREKPLLGVQRMRAQHSIQTFAEHSTFIFPTRQQCLQQNIVQISPFVGRASTTQTCTEYDIHSPTADEPLHSIRNDLSAMTLRRASKRFSSDFVLTNTRPSVVTPPPAFLRSS